MRMQGSVDVEVSLQTALAMYGLPEARILCEESTDTRCLVAWSHDIIVVAFRGTASAVNVKADLQARQRLFSACTNLC